MLASPDTPFWCWLCPPERRTCSPPQVISAACMSMSTRNKTYLNPTGPGLLRDHRKRPDGDAGRRLVTSSGTHSSAHSTTQPALVTVVFESNVTSMSYMYTRSTKLRNTLSTVALVTLAAQRAPDLNCGKAESGVSYGADSRL